MDLSIFAVIWRDRGKGNNFDRSLLGLRLLGRCALAKMLQIRSWHLQ